MIKKVVGGEDADYGEFPHAAALGFYEGPEKKFFCGGTLISEKFVLTAAHCRRSGFIFVRLGYLNIYSPSFDDQGKDYDIKRFINHPDYSASLNLNDIALVELSQSIEYDFKVF